MKLLISNRSVPKAYRDLFAEAFPLLTQRLGISDYKANITLRFETKPPEDLGDPPSPRATFRGGGWTDPKGRPRHDFIFKATRDFEMILNPEAPAKKYFFGNKVAFESPSKPRDVLAAACHEMIHVKQYLTGRLRARQVNGQWQSVFCGVPVTVDYYDQPWEKEAYAEMEPLADWVWARLKTRPGPIHKT